MWTTSASGAGRMSSALAARTKRETRRRPASAPTVRRPRSDSPLELTLDSPSASASAPEKGLMRMWSPDTGGCCVLSGRLTNADGQSLEGATIEALETRPDGTTLPLGLATTNACREVPIRAPRHSESQRRISLRAVPGESASASARFHLNVPGTTSIQVNRRRVRNGRSVLFTGRVVTRPLPPNGKLIEMQAYFRGRWRTFVDAQSRPRAALGNSATGSALPSAA